MSSRFLTQEEVDALLERVDGPAPQRAVSAPGKVRDVELGRQAQAKHEHLPALELIHERFARTLRAGLAKLIRRDPVITVGPLTVEAFADFMNAVSMPANVNLLQLRPLRGTGLLICEPRLVSAIVDTMFGGNGSRQRSDGNREFSATEQRIIERVVELVCDEYRKAWQDVHPLRPGYLRSETHLRHASIVPPEQNVVWTRFELTIGESGGALWLCLPCAALEPILDTLTTAQPGTDPAADTGWSARLSRQIESVEVLLVADLGHAYATVADLVSLEAGDFIELDLDRTLTARVDGVPLLDCQYGISGGRRALKLESFLTGGQDRPNGASDDNR